MEEGKKYIAWKLNAQYRKDPEEQIILLYDFMNAGLSNMVGLISINFNILRKH